MNRWLLSGTWISDIEDTKEEESSDECPRLGGERGNAGD